MENIGYFLAGCEAIGIKKVDLFQTVDLYEGTNILQVPLYSCVELSGRHLYWYSGYQWPPSFGKKMPYH